MHADMGCGVVRRYNVRHPQCLVEFPTRTRWVWDINLELLLSP